jgi:hypothetical protein
MLSRWSSIARLAPRAAPRLPKSLVARAFSSAPKEVTPCAARRSVQISWARIGADDGARGARLRHGGGDAA